MPKIFIYWRITLFLWAYLLLYKKTRAAVFLTTLVVLFNFLYEPVEQLANGFSLFVCRGKYSLSGVGFHFQVGGQRIAGAIKKRPALFGCCKRKNLCGKSVLNFFSRKPPLSHNV